MTEKKIQKNNVIYSAQAAERTPASGAAGGDAGARRGGGTTGAEGRRCGLPARRRAWRAKWPAGEQRA